MNKKLLLCALLAFVGWVSADAQRTVKRHLLLTDEAFCLEIWPADKTSTNTYDAQNNTFYIATFGNSVGWQWVPWHNAFDFFDFSMYDKLVVRLKSIKDKEGNPAELVLRLSTDLVAGIYETRLNKDNGYAVEIDLTNGIETNSAENSGNKLNLGKVSQLNFWGDKEITAEIDEIYLERTLADGEEDFQPIDLTQCKPMWDGVSFNEKNYTVTSSDAGLFGIEFETPQDWSKYRYLVVVPNREFIWGSPNIKYILSDGTTEVDNYKFSNANWNSVRAVVLDMEKMVMHRSYTDETVISWDDNKDYTAFDRAKVNKFVIRTDFARDYRLQTAYLTNTAPVYQNFLNNGDSRIPGKSDYVREVTEKDKYGTICLPYAAAVCGADVYDVVGVDSKENPTTLYMKRVYGVLEAGKAYLYKTNYAGELTKDGDDATIKTLTLKDYHNGERTVDVYPTNVTFYRAGANKVKEPSAENTMLKGVFRDTNVPAGAYIMSKNKWRKSNSSKVGVYYAYLSLENAEVITPEDASNAKLMKLDMGETTGISTVETDDRRGDDAVYSLSGVRVSNPSKGLYIKNGKKFIVK